MEIKITTGCMADSMTVDGVEEIYMTEEQRRKALECIGEYIKKIPTDNLNYVLQYIESIADSKDLIYDEGYHCDQCGDDVFTFTLNI